MTLKRTLVGLLLFSLAVLSIIEAGHRLYPTVVFPVKLEAQTHQHALDSIDRMKKYLNPSDQLQLQFALTILGMDGVTKEQMEDPSFDGMGHAYKVLQTLEGLSAIQIIERGRAVAARIAQVQFLNKQKASSQPPPAAPSSLPGTPEEPEAPTPSHPPRPLPHIDDQGVVATQAEPPRDTAIP